MEGYYAGRKVYGIQETERESICHVLLKFLKKKKATTVRNSYFMNQSLSLFSAVTEGLVHKGYCLTKVIGKSIK